MKKISLIVVLILISAYLSVFVSCTKNHVAAPTPPNYRLHSVEVISTINGGKLKNENYTFSYDTKNRVIKYVYSSNDTSYPNIDVFYTYIDTASKIFKKYYKLNDTTLIRLDSFLYNTSAQIVAEWTPLSRNQFQYNGKLLVQLTDSTGATTIYNAHEGDFYKSSSTICYDSSQTFLFYKTLNNRIGDYLQLRSFLFYGQDIYQNTHLIKEIDNSGYTTQATYVIDADSKVTQTNTAIVDSVGNNYNYTYNLAYETY